ncbi:MAG: hypothetical protein PHW04_08195 [Candidatus Wallbacteria bacterium]|nr:hypothetical protein [Candidatus Wallbacteria bacterium]
MKARLSFICLFLIVSGCMAVGISERQLLSAYATSEVLKEPVHRDRLSRLKGHFELDCSLNGHYQSDLNFIPEIDDFIDPKYSDSENKDVAVQPTLWGRYVGYHPYLIFNLNDRFSLYSFRHYSHENRWWNDFETELGFHWSSWKMVFVPGIYYEEYAQGKFFYQEKYKLVCEFKCLGFEGILNNYNFYSVDERDARERIFFPYMFYQNGHHAFKIGYRQEHRRSRQEYYSFLETYPSISWSYQIHSWKIALDYSYCHKDFDLTQPSDKRAREDSVGRNSLELVKKLRNHEVFARLSNERRNSNLYRYDFDFHTVDVGLNYTF